MSTRCRPRRAPDLIRTGPTLIGDAASPVTRLETVHGVSFRLDRLTPTGVYKGAFDNDCDRREARPMKLGVIIPQGWTGDYDGWDPAKAWGRSVALARQADELGIESI